MTSEITELKKEIKHLRLLLRSQTPDLKTMLARHGFFIYKKEPEDDLIIPANASMKRRFYEYLKKYSFRLFLRDVIKHQESFTSDDVARYATKEVAIQYISFLMKAELIEPIPDNQNAYSLIKKPVKSFGETLEWFMSELIKKDFGAETIWGVKFKRHRIGGDYDLLAKIDSSILYMEIKSSPPKQIYDKEITAFLDRVIDLSPEVAIFFMDTELRMKDKIVPMFEAELKKRYKQHIPVERLERELYHIKKKIFIINSKESVEANLRTVLNFSLFRKKEIFSTGGDE
ncbi:MAG: hypothetical protein HZC11_02325 [Nitrospirae bacterium]|nr:hypothetical protein [Nitrospirota bacterium]